MSTILIVEDHPESRCLLERLLVSRGHQVMAAENGEEALRLAQEDPPDVIISDIMMPVMNGFKLCSEVKKDPDLRQIPFIFYTATFTDASDRDLAMSLGASRFVVKPTEGDQFIQILDDVLKAHRNGILPVPEGPLEGQEVLLEMYENSITRKLAETVEKLQDERRALIQSERRLKEAQELAHIGHWELDLKTGSLEWSDQIYRILGVKPRAFDPSYKTLMTMEVIHPDDRAFVSRAHRESLSKKTPCDIEYRLLLKDGIVRYVNERFQTLYDDEGMPTCAMGTVQDITEHKRAQEAQWASEERYKTLFEEALDGICIADAETGVIIECNQALSSLVGRERAELIGQPQTILHPPDDELGTLSRTFRQHLTDKDGQIVETQVVTRDGAIREVEIKANRVDLGGRTALQGIFRDVTERKKAEEALRESETKYRILVENAGDGIFIAQEGMLRFCNEKTEVLSGRTRQELLSAPFVTFIHPDDQALVLERHIKRQQGIDLPSSYPFRIIHKSGEVKWVELNVVAVRWEGKAATLNFLRDISRRKQTEEEQAKLQAQFNQAQKMESIGVLAGGVAHDFNNILTTIIGNAQLAMADLPKGDLLREDLEEIRKAGERGSMLTRQLLTFSRRETCQPEILDLNEVVHDMDKLLRRLIRENIELRTIQTPGLWKVEVDPGQMEQVIMNLVVNARDVMLDGGTLSIETANVELDAAYFGPHDLNGEPGQYVMLVVTDTGPGMDEAIKKRIFEPFFTTKEKGAGTGLGLSTVYGIIKQNRGYIWPYSEPGKGTTMKIYLPRAGDAPKAVKEVATFEKEAGGGEMVLLVEDDASLRELAQKSLRKAGYKVLTAADGEEALRVIEGFDGEIRLLLTDVAMPRMGGKELAERAVSLCPGIKVLYMSGYPDNAPSRDGALGTETSFLPKPFSPESLCRKVRETIGNE